LSFAQVKDVIEQSRRASPLRHRIMIANQRCRIAHQIVREISKLVGAATSDDVCRIFDRHFAGLADDDRENVVDILDHICRTKIKYLELLQERIAQEKAPLLAPLHAEIEARAEADLRRRTNRNGSCQNRTRGLTIRRISRAISNRENPHDYRDG
jgi:hypothetical protein